MQDGSLKVFRQNWPTVFVPRRSRRKKESHEKISSVESWGGGERNNENVGGTELKDSAETIREEKIEERSSKGEEGGERRASRYVDETAGSLLHPAGSYFLSSCERY